MRKAKTPSTFQNARTLAARAAAALQRSMTAATEARDVAEELLAQEKAAKRKEDQRQKYQLNKYVKRFTANAVPAGLARLASAALAWTEAEAPPAELTASTTWRADAATAGYRPLLLEETDAALPWKDILQSAEQAAEPCAAHLQTMLQSAEHKSTRGMLQHVPPTPAFTAAAQAAVRALGYPAEAHDVTLAITGFRRYTMRWQPAQLPLPGFPQLVRPRGGEPLCVVLVDVADAADAGCKTLDTLAELLHTRQGRAVPFKAAMVPPGSLLFLPFGTIGMLAGAQDRNLSEHLLLGHKRLFEQLAPGPRDLCTAWVVSWLRAQGPHEPWSLLRERTLATVAHLATVANLATAGPPASAAAAPLDGGAA